jgi:hypothetical protein
MFLSSDRLSDVPLIRTIRSDPAVDAVADDSMLIHHQEIVLSRVFIIQQANDDVAFFAVHLMCHGHAFHQHLMDEVVLCHQATVGGIPHPAQGLVPDALAWGGVELLNGGTQAFQQRNFAVVLAFQMVTIGANYVGEAQFLEESPDVVFDGGLVEVTYNLCLMVRVAGPACSRSAESSRPYSWRQTRPQAELVPPAPHR